MNKHILQLPQDDLISCWCFEEMGRTPRQNTSNSMTRLALQEMNGPITRVRNYPGSIFGEYSAYLQPGQYFQLNRKDQGPLNRFGENSALTLMAVILRHPFCDTETGRNFYENTPACEFIAGVWDETRRKRQYGLFLNLHNNGSSHQVCGHVSGNGLNRYEDGPVSAAISGKKVSYHQWHVIGMSYDGLSATAYLDGVCYPNDLLNPLHYPYGLFDGGPDGAHFQVGANHAFGRMHNFFYGYINGLIIYQRSFSPQEIQAMSQLMLAI